MTGKQPVMPGQIRCAMLPFAIDGFVGLFDNVRRHLWFLEMASTSSTNTVRLRVAEPDWEALAVPGRVLCSIIRTCLDAFARHWDRSDRRSDSAR